MATNYITAEGLEKLKSELQQLETVERPRVIAAIAEAREKGDLSENAEYSAAKEEQGHLERRIAQLRAKIADSQVLSEKDIDTSTVQILVKVRVLNMKSKEEKVYQLVAESEANRAEGKIAITTPIAQGLLRKKVGDTVSITIPAGILELKILEIFI
ncbi:MAG: transcription elongation factor GreA [Paludibacteraceae bacterium]|nr:transcription elongation factor GreA [Paludibacteraceae bacterium]